MVRAKFCILFIAAGLSLALTSFNDNNTLTVNVINIKKITGEMEIGIFNESEDFPHEGSQLFKFREIVTNDTLTTILDSLPDGEYALAIYHDINNDGECNTNFIRYPKEPFAFSNNVRPFLKAPSFKSAKFSIPQTKEVFIKLNK